MPTYRVKFRADKEDQLIEVKEDRGQRYVLRVLQ